MVALHQAMVPLLAASLLGCRSPGLISLG